MYRALQLATIIQANHRVSNVSDSFSHGSSNHARSILEY
jgi:hypothetical protein